MLIDLGDIPVGSPPSSPQAAQLRSALGVVNFPGFGTSHSTAAYGDDSRFYDNLPYGRIITTTVTSTLETSDLKHVFCVFGTGAINPILNIPSAFGANNDFFAVYVDKQALMSGTRTCLVELGDLLFTHLYTVNNGDFIIFRKLNGNWFVETHPSIDTVSATVVNGGGATAALTGSVSGTTLSLTLTLPTQTISVCNGDGTSTSYNVVVLPT